jgi:hypothetical protein
MRNLIVNDWNKLFPTNDRGQTIISNDSIHNMGLCIGNFLARSWHYDIPGWEQPKEIQNFREVKNRKFELQNIATVTDYEEFFNDLKKQFETMTVFDDDEGYRLIFDMFPLEGTDGWDTRTSTFNTEARRIYPGENIYYYGGADSKYRVYVAYYGAGYALERYLVDTRQFIKIERDLFNMRKVMMNKKAAVFYALIEAIGAGQNIAWQNPVPATLPNTADTYTANRDVQTIQLAVNTLYANNKNKGYNYGMNTPLFILYPYQLDARIRMALNLTMSTWATQKWLTNPFVLIKTDQLSSSSSYYIGIPKNKAEGGELLNLTQFNLFNMDNYTEKFAHWMAYGGNIGDEQQFQRCASS